MRKRKPAGRGGPGIGWAFMQARLTAKYSDSFLFFLAKPVNEIVRGIPSQAMVGFREMLTFDAGGETLRRFYRSYETDIRLKNYSDFYAAQGQPMPCCEKLSARYVMQKRKKRLKKLAGRIHQGPEQKKASARPFRPLLPQIDHKTLYLSAVESSQSRGEFDSSEEPNRSFAEPRGPRAKPQKSGEVWDAFEASGNSSRASEWLPLDFEVRRRSRSIPTEISELAELPLSGIFADRLDPLPDRPRTRGNLVELSLKPLEDMPEAPGKSREPQNTGRTKREKFSSPENTLPFAPHPAAFKKPKPQKPSSIPKKRNKNPPEAKQPFQEFPLPRAKKKASKSTIPRDSAATIKPSKALQIEPCLIGLIQPHSLFRANFTSRDFSLRSPIGAKNQPFLLSEGLRQKLRKKAAGFEANFVRSSPLARSISPEPPQKCFTDRHAKLKNPLSSSNNFRQNSRTPLVNLSPNLLSTKGSDPHKSLKSPQLFKTLNLAHSPKNKALFCELFRNNMAQTSDGGFIRPGRKADALIKSLSRPLLKSPSLIRQKGFLELTKDQSKGTASILSKPPLTAKSFSLLKKPKQAFFFANF